jgi:hypothetical protein
MKLSEWTQVTTTAGAVASPILTYPVRSGTGAAFQLMVSAKNTATGRSANTVVTFGAQNLGGVAAILGVPAVGLSVANGSDAAMALCVVAVTAVGGNLVVNGTGLLATNIQWIASLMLVGG